MSIDGLVEQYENLRDLILGSRLELAVPDAHLLVAESADFDRFVSMAYVAIRETLADDVTFFQQIGAMKSHRASNTLHQLRTARQHADNARATAFYEAWIGPAPIDWESAASKLRVEVEDFLEALVRAASTVRSSQLFRKQWTETAAVSVPDIFDAVCRDLGLSFYAGARAAKIRAIESRYRRDRPKAPKARATADLCVQEALAETGLLPVAHSELLDALGLLGDRRAAAAITLAYATARALPSLSGDDFMRRVSTTWWALVGTA